MIQFLRPACVNVKVRSPGLKGNPGVSLPAVWGTISGEISDQADLEPFVSEVVDAALTTVGRSYRQTFVQANLTIALLLPVTHGLNTLTPTALIIYDGSGAPIGAPDSIEILNPNQLSVNLESFAPLQGTWAIAIGA